MNIGAAFTLIRNGASIKQTDSAGGIPITRIETIANRVIDRNHMGYADIYNGDKYSSYFLRDGDILMSHINSIQHLGKAAIYHPLDEKEKIIHGMNLLVLRANQKILDNQFAYFYFSSDSFLHKLPRITKKSVNQASFTVSELKKIDIPCPALSQQHKIAKILSIIQTLCNKRNEQLKIFDELVKSRFIEMFGKPSELNNFANAQIKDVVSVGVGIVIKPTRFYSNDKSGKRAFRSLNIGPFGVSPNSEWVYFTNEAMAENKRTIVHEGDVLIVRSGNPGTCCVVPKEYDGCNVIDLIIAHPNKRKILPEYLCAFTNMPHGMNQVNNQKHGVAQRHFNVSMYEKMKIYVPNLSLQQQYVNFMMQVDKSKLAVQKSLDELETLKKSLMQTYFG